MMGIAKTRNGTPCEDAQMSMRVFFFDNGDQSSCASCKCSSRNQKISVGNFDRPVVLFILISFGLSIIIHWKLLGPFLIHLPSLKYTLCHRKFEKLLETVRVLDFHKN